MDALAEKLQKALGSAYELGALLGRGGMGAVYRATDRRLRREVAVKVLPPELGYSQDLRTRFVREAQMAAGLSHPNIVSIYDVGDRDDLVWFVMAFVDGESVRAKVEREGPQPVTVVRRVLQEVAQALAYAHARGVIHRDIKPDNIMLDRGSGRALVTDFGIAKALTAEETELTRPGEVVGTARYMAPEQALAETTVDARADQYSLGLVGYFMLTGTHALKATSLPGLIAEHVKGPTIDFAKADRRLPQPLVAAVTRCLAPKPEARFPRMEEFAEALRELGGELPDTPAPVRRLMRETERAFVVGTVGALALGFVGVENVAPSLIMVLAGMVIGQWVQAVEQCSRRGMTWSVIRRALYVERARRVEEIEEGGHRKLGAASLVAIAGLLAGAVIWNRPAVQSGINTLLFYLGAFGSLVAARLFGMPRVSARRRRVAVLVAMGALLAAGVAFLVRFLRTGGASRPVNAFAVGMFLGATAIGVTLGILVFRFLGKRLAPTRVGGLEVQHEWRVPRWLDVAGSWLFGRFVREGWRIRFERDRPVAASEARLGLSAARQAERRVRHLAAGLTGSAASAGKEAQRLAADLVTECRRAEQELQPLLARIARLSEGVLVSRTVAAGGSIETELDQAERQADALRKSGAECLDMLRALGAGMEFAAESRDTALLDAALKRAREFSSGVCRRVAQAQPA